VRQVSGSNLTSRQRSSPEATNKEKKMTKLEKIFDEFYEMNNDMAFEFVVPADGDFDDVFRKNSSLEFSIEDVEAAYLFSDSVGQCLAIRWR
jgi:hypothetical protein